MVLTLIPAATVTAHAETVASGECGDNLTWTLDDQGTLTISGTGKMWDWYINFYEHAYEQKYPSWYAYRESIQQIVIGDGVTSIGRLAFYNFTALTGMTIPAGITSVGGMAFRDCTALTEVTFLGSAPSFPKDYSNPDIVDLSWTFYGVTATVYYPGADATWTEDVKYRSGLSGTLTWVPSGDGTYCPPHGVCGYNVTWELDDEGTLTISGSGAINDDLQSWWYGYREAITHVVIGDEVTSIGQYAFCDLTALPEVTIPASVTSVGGRAFQDCTALTEVTFLGSAPDFPDCYEPELDSGWPSEAFSGVTATAYYPVADDTWTEDVRQNYGGNLTWVAYGEPDYAVVEQPQDVTAYLGESARFELTTNFAVTEYQWQMLVPGGEWEECQCASSWSTSNGIYQVCLEIDHVAFSESGNQYRCLIIGENGQVISEPATLTVVVTPGDEYAVVEESGNTAAYAGEDVVFRIWTNFEVTGCQWEMLIPGGDWEECDRAGTWNSGWDENQAFLRLRDIAMTENGTMYRCTAFGAEGQATSQPMLLTVLTDDPTEYAIVDQTGDVIAYAGDDVGFTVWTNFSITHYQWQVMVPGGDWENLSCSSGGGPNDVSATIYDVALTDSGNQYRCIVSGENGQVTSEPMTLTVMTDDPMEYAVLTQPQDVTAAVGESVQFELTTNFSISHCRWQVMVPGGSWQDFDGSVEVGVNKAGMTIESVTAAASGSRYRCIVTGTKGQVISRAATLTVPSPRGYHIIVTNKTNGAASTSIDTEALHSGDVTFTVNCNKACVVAIVNGDGTYTKLACTTGNGEHKFTVTVTDADVEIVVAIKGDVNLDGKISTMDATMAKQKYLGTAFAINPALQMLTADVNGDNKITTMDATMIKQAYLGSATLSW
ncbi:MAG: leucine-rich repeat protein [Oscillospiraceae bacterium]|nr:leucine-rich repeat protein [Oscillospiraceae bacterium]